MAPEVRIGVTIGIGKQDRDQHGGGPITYERDRIRQARSTRRRPYIRYVRYRHAFRSSPLRYRPQALAQRCGYGNPGASEAPTMGRPGSLTAGALARA